MSPKQELAMKAGRLRNIYSLASQSHIRPVEAWFLRWVADRALARLGVETETNRRVRQELERGWETADV